jgi:hypothetical protein
MEGVHLVCCVCELLGLDWRGRTETRVPTTLRYHPINPIKSELHEGLSLVLACPCPSSILCFAFPFPHPGRTGRTGSIGCLSLSLSCPTVSIWCTCCVRPQCVRSLAFLPCQPCAAVRVEKERARVSVPASAASRGATNYRSNLLLSASPVVLNSVALASFRHLHGAPGRAGHLDHQLAGKGREKKTE